MILIQTRQPLTAIRFLRLLASAAIAILAVQLPVTAQSVQTKQKTQSTQSANALNLDLLSRGRSAFPRFWNAYRPATLPAPNLANGPKVSTRIHGGKLTLSLSEFLQLVVENSLDLESARYNYLIAQVDFLRARSGQAARGAPGAPVPGALFAGAIGAGVGNNGNVSNAGTGGTAISAAARQVTIGPRGTFDPTLSVNMSWDRVVNPLNSLRVAGTPTVAIPSAALQTRVQQELPFGTSYALAFNMQRQSTTQAHILYNPAYTSFFSLQVYQPLMNGFGRAFNQRFIRLTANERRMVYESFHTNLNNTLSAAADAYWDFVALRERQQVAEQALAFSEKVYQETQQRIEIGILAPSELVRAESQVAASRRDAIVAETSAQLQEVNLKSLITKAIGPDIDAIPFEPTDALAGVTDAPIPPLQDALHAAMQRSSIRQAELGLENQQIAEMFTRTNLRPTLSIFAQVNNYTLAPGTNQMFRQLFRFVYPEYSVGFSLSFSVKNRAAQADNVRARIERQQAEMGFERSKADVDVQVRSTIASLTQSRSQVEAAQRAVAASQATADANQFKWGLGVSTLDDVLQSQLDLMRAEAADIQSRVNYAKANIAEEVAVGNLLERHGIDFDEALRGSLWSGSSKP